MNLHPVKIKKIPNYDGPLSIYENRVLVAVDTKFNYNGPCVRCGDVIKLHAVNQEVSNLCCECQYRLPRNRKKKD